MNRNELKRERQRLLLAKMEKTPMTGQQMAEFLKVNSKVISNYITELKYRKKIYVYEYVRTGGTPKTYYKTGDLPNAERLEPLTKKDYNDRFRMGMSNHRTVKFIPKMDIAASWMLNPL